MLNLIEFELYQTPNLLVFKHASDSLIRTNILRIQIIKSEWGKQEKSLVSEIKHENLCSKKKCLVVGQIQKKYENVEQIQKKQKLRVQTNLLFSNWKGLNMDEFKQLHLKNGTM